MRKYNVINVTVHTILKSETDQIYFTLGCENDNRKCKQNGACNFAHFEASFAKIYVFVFCLPTQPVLSSHQRRGCALLEKNLRKLNTH